MPPRHTPLRLLGLAVFAGITGPASAATTLRSWNSGFSSGGVVPDGNPTGWSDQRTLSGIPTTITDVNVSLTLTAEWGGDLYVFLQHGAGLSVLLNRPGRTANTIPDSYGFSDSGFDVIFDDTGAAGDSHLTFTGALLTGGAFQPDGRLVDPATVLDSDSRTAFLSIFNAMDPNGDWTLFVADMSADGGIPVVVTRWGLEFTSVSEIPEPSQILGLAVLLSSSLFVRRRSRGTQA